MAGCDRPRSGDMTITPKLLRESDLRLLHAQPYREEGANDLDQADSPFRPVLAVGQRGCASAASPPCFAGAHTHHVRCSRWGTAAACSYPSSRATPTLRSGAASRGLTARLASARRSPRAGPFGGAAASAATTATARSTQVGDGEHSQFRPRCRRGGSGARKKSPATVAASSSLTPGQSTLLDLGLRVHSLRPPRTPSRAGAAIVVPAVEHSARILEIHFPCSSATPGSSALRAGDATPT